MLHVLSRLPGKLQDPRLVHTASRTRLLVFRPHHASWLRHHPVALALPQPRCAPHLLVVQIAPALLRLCRASGRAVPPLDFSSVASRSLVVDYFAYAARPGASARRTARHAACRAARRRLLCLARARRRLLRPRRASGCLGTSRGSSRGSSHRSSSTTSPPPCVRVSRYVARLVTRLVVPLVVDYFASAARPGASARCAARHAARRAARRRLLCLRRASGCLGTSRGSSRGSSRRSSSTTPPHVGSSSTTLPTPRVRVP
jgi:hypothetical protein